MFEIIRVTRPSIYSFLPKEAQLGLSQGLFETLVGSRSNLVQVLQNEDATGLDVLLIGQVKNGVLTLSNIWLRPGTPMVWLEKMFQICEAWGEVNGAEVLEINVDPNLELVNILITCGLKVVSTKTLYQKKLDPN